jgi:hypothetical protein
MSRPVTSLSYAARREVIERMAPCYHEASFVQKGLLLDSIVATTGYARKYAIGLLNHVPEGRRAIQRHRLSRYGQEVQHALLVAWKATSYICAKRLIPFLPTLVAILEQRGHLQLSEESRRQLLTMSVATAERLLHAQRKLSSHGLCTTQAGPLLKHRIPIRTFHQRDEAQPSFLKASLVAHRGRNTEGSYLSTLILTDVATGWTECLPLLSMSAETVLAAFRQARRLNGATSNPLPQTQGPDRSRRVLESAGRENSSAAFGRGKEHQFLPIHTICLFL